MEKIEALPPSSQYGCFVAFIKSLSLLYQNVGSSRQDDLTFRFRGVSCQNICLSKRTIMLIA